ncbi:uncharacterized protein LOC127747683 [Arachis duranensis]|uniref:Uncharacterized protein LOC127747683 n=1 Tax=Arachis duranensis TaxID=130453 RepID=A0A9C6TWB4_ARADU|nr:uncharacterized protein LOC127747683 [Arachis duranensis]
MKTMQINKEEQIKHWSKASLTLISFSFQAAPAASSFSALSVAAARKTAVGEPSTTVRLQRLLLHIPSVPFALPPAESTASCSNPSLSCAPSRFHGNAAATCFFIVRASSSQSQGKTAARSGDGLAKNEETHWNPPPHLRGSPAPLPRVRSGGASSSKPPPLCSTEASSVPTKTTAFEFRCGGFGGGRGTLTFVGFGYANSTCSSAIANVTAEDPARKVGLLDSLKDVLISLLLLRSATVFVIIPETSCFAVHSNKQSTEQSLRKYEFWDHWKHGIEEGTKPQVYNEEHDNKDLQQGVAAARNRD